MHSVALTKLLPTNFNEQKYVFVERKVVRRDALEVDTSKHNKQNRACCLQIKGLYDSVFLTKGDYVCTQNMNKFILLCIRASISETD